MLHHLLPFSYFVIVFFGGTLLLGRFLGIASFLTWCVVPLCTAELLSFIYQAVTAGDWTVLLRLGAGPALFGAVLHLEHKKQWNTIGIAALRLTALAALAATVAAYRMELQPDVYFTGAFLDQLGRAVVALLFASTHTRAGLTLVPLLVAAGGHSLAEALLFQQLQVEKNTNTWTMRLALLVALVQTWFWFKVTLQTPAIGSVQELYSHFDSSALTRHTFFDIFIGPWFLMALLWFLPLSLFCNRPELPHAVNFVVGIVLKVALSGLLLGNITPALWVIYKLSVDRLRS